MFVNPYNKKGRRVIKVVVGKHYIIQNGWTDDFPSVVKVTRDITIPRQCNSRGRNRIPEKKIFQGIDTLNGKTVQFAVKHVLQECNKNGK